MEALTAARVAALTVYDMVKGVERGAEIASVVLLEKSGGRSGEWRRADPDVTRGAGSRVTRKLAPHEDRDPHDLDLGGRAAG